MPRAEIASKQALHTLSLLHAELAGKLLDIAAERKRLTLSMLQVEAVMKLLAPGYNVQAIAVRRRKPNPWFKRGTVFREALDVLRTAERPLTAREITHRMLAAKGVENASMKAVRDLTGGVNSSLRNHKGGLVTAVGMGAPLQWKISG
jgi:hypothetical protein